jgi:hypothetical protein
VRGGLAPLVAHVLALLLALGLGVRGAGAQRLEIRLPAPTQLASEGPQVRATGILDDREMRNMLAHGFPLRVHYRTELWTVGGWVNDLRASWEWDVIVRLDPLDRSYGVARIVGDQITPLGRFRDFAQAAEAVSRPYRVPIVPPRGRRAYYALAVDVETLSVNDLDEVEGWLRGELRPAVRGQRNPGTALGRGVRTLFTRLLGSETRHYEGRSATFRP